jgi:signal transduction histidine kinase
MTSAERVTGAGSRWEDLNEALYEVTTALNMGVDRQQVLERIAVQLHRLVPHTELMIGRADPVARIVTPVFTQGPYAHRKRAMRIGYGEGLTGRVAATGRPVVYNQSEADDPTLSPKAVSGSPALDDEYVLAVPLHGPDSLEGILVIYRQGPGQQRWRPDDVRVVELFAAQAQVALHNAELFEAATQRAKRLAAMNEVLRCTSTGLDADVGSICASWENALRGLIPFTISGIALEGPSGECLAVWLSGETIDFSVGQPLPPESGPMWAMRNGRGYVLDDIRVSSPYGGHAGLEDGSIAAVVVVPLKARGRNYGVIGLGHRDPGTYDRRTQALLEEVGVYLSAAIDNALLYQEILDRKANQSRLLSKLISAQEEERSALATELHDDTIQVLAAALLRLDRIADIQPGRVPELIAKLRDTLAAAMGRARRTMVNLRSPVLDTEGLEPALRQQLDTLASEWGVQVGLTWKLNCRLDPTTETVLFRSLQEALQNVRKHARAGRVEVELREEAGGSMVVGVIRDDGVGFEVGSVLRRAIHGGHVGLHSMFERVEAAGGRVDLDATPGGGTRLTVSIPTTIGVPE